VTDHDADLTERARQLSAEAEHVYGVTKRRKEALLTAKEQALKSTGEAESRDGSVRATVDAGGMLTNLTLATEALRMKPGDLAGLVTTVTQQAAVRAREAVWQTYESLRNEGIVRGMPVLLPGPTPQPEPPRHPRRKEAEEEASYEERTITRRSRPR
jgi:hypothetical protein